MRSPPSSSRVTQPSPKNQQQAPHDGEFRPARIRASGTPPRGRRPDRSHTHAVASRSTARRYTGHPGDTLASALLANGVMLVGRSFKYHRPRGISPPAPRSRTRWSSCAMAHAASRTRKPPRSRSVRRARRPGARTAGRRSAFDLMSVNSLLSPVFVAGFYYKTFMWPAAFWEKLYEPIIRRAAGLGRASDDADPDTYEKATAFADVLIIGAGPAGLVAALGRGALQGTRDSRRRERHAGRPCHRRRAPRSTASPGHEWVQGRRGRARRNCRRSRPPPHDGVRLLRRRHLRRHRARVRSSRRAQPACRASGSGGSSPSACARDRRHRAAASCSPATTARASCSPAPSAPTSTASASYRAASARRLHQQRLWRDDRRPTSCAPAPRSSPGRHARRAGV